MADDDFDLSLDDEDEETEATLALDEDDVTVDEDDDMTVDMDGDEDDDDDAGDVDDEDDDDDGFDAADVGMAVADMRKSQGTMVYSLFLILSFLLYAGALSVVLLEIHEYSHPDEFMWGLFAEEK